MMRNWMAAVVIGAGLLLMAGCECACTQSACPVPANVQDEKISARMAPAEYPSVTMGGDVDVRFEVLD